MREKPVRVLIVEDNPADLRYVRIMLSGFMEPAFEVEATNTLAGALAAIQRTQFDAVLLDLTLPDSWGLDTIVRLVSGQPQMPVVILTALADEEMARLAIQRGAQEYLIKADFDARLLARCIRHATERHRLLRAAAAGMWVEPETGVLSRQGFLAMVGQQLSYARRSGIRMVLLRIDIPMVKAFSGVADDQSQAAERLVAEAVRRVTREADIVAHLASGELAVLALDVSDGVELAITRRIHSRLSEVAGDGAGSPLRVEVSSKALGAVAGLAANDLLSRGGLLPVDL
ncbi:MAG: response regulator [Deltaproteobacteria bacterium]|nr:response regulator [Deltaproteobacteria bacterium]